LKVSLIFVYDLPLPLVDFELLIELEFLPFFC